MKIISSLLIGAVLGIIVYFIMIKFNAPVVSNLLPNSKVKALSPPDVQANIPALLFNHDEQGQLLQTVDMLDHDDYRSTEGNAAELFFLGAHGCKIRVTIGGETYFAYRSFYFKDQDILHASEITYRYPNGGMTNLSAPNAFETELYSSETFNPKSTPVQAEVSYLKSQFLADHLRRCISP